MNEEKSLISGAIYFLKGWQIISQRGLRRFVILPIVVNILLLLSLFWVFIQTFGGWVSWIMHFIPSWLDWLSSMIWLFAIGIVLSIFYFIFNTLSGFIAAPFNGLLAEKVEKMLTGEILQSQSSIEFLKDIPRILWREWQKLMYSLPRYLVIFLLGFIPVIGPIIAPILSFVFTAWLMAIQYCDYPFDNHKIPFHQMRFSLAENKWENLGFGSLVSLCTLVPFLNFIIIPVAVCGATAMWVETYRSQPKFIGLPYRK